MNDNDNFSNVPAGQATMDRVVQSAHAAVDRLAELAAPRVQRLQSTVTQANTKLHDSAAAVRSTGDRWTENLRDNVREKPLTALATALVAGLVIARL